MTTCRRTGRVVLQSQAGAWPLGQIICQTGASQLSADAVEAVCGSGPQPERPVPSNATLGHPNTGSSIKTPAVMTKPTSARLVM